MPFKKHQISKIITSSLILFIIILLTMIIGFISSSTHLKKNLGNLNENRKDQTPKTFMQNHPQEKIIFFSNDNEKSKETLPKVYLVNRFTGQRASVVYLNISVKANYNLAQAYGVTKIPFAIINNYHQEKVSYKKADLLSSGISHQFIVEVIFCLIILLFVCFILTGTFFIIKNSIKNYRIKIKYKN